VYRRVPQEHRVMNLTGEILRFAFYVPILSKIDSFTRNTFRVSENIHIQVVE
jgi:hypothetical protein